MTTPQRIQRKRTRGWRMPPNTVYVGRHTKWGNPWLLNDENLLGYLSADAQVIVVRYFERWLTCHEYAGRQDLVERRERIVRDLHELRGKNLACYCPLDKPCHADVLLRLANEG